MAQPSTVQKFTLKSAGTVGAPLDFAVLPEYDSYDVGYKIITRSWNDMRGTMHQIPIAAKDVVKGTFTCSESKAKQLRGYIQSCVLNGITYFDLNYYDPGGGFGLASAWKKGLFYIAAENHVKALAPWGPSMTPGYVQFDLEFIEVDGVKLQNNNPQLGVSE